MNYLFGIWHFDGRPAQAALTHMSHAVARLPHDDLRLWTDGAVGFGVLIRWMTPEAVHDRQPLHESSTSFIFSGRLDYRAELGAALTISPDELARMDDSDLLLRAYRRWGLDAIHRLVGDWTFAAWEGETQRLILARDQHGLGTLYYHHNARFFAFASSLTALAALSPDVPLRPNLVYAAHVLASFPAPAQLTAYESLHGLPAGHHLTVTPAQAAPQRYYWLEHAPPVRFKHDDEYPARLGELYAASVRERLRTVGRVGSQLSGGLDSGSSTTLAASALAERGERLTAYCSVPIHDTAGWLRDRYGDESPYAALTAALQGNIDLNLVPASDITPLEGVRQALAIFQQPGHVGSNWYWLIACAALAQQQQVRTLLVGQFGNGTVSWRGNLSPLDWLMLRRFKRGLGLPLLQALAWARRERAVRQRAAPPYRAYSAILPAYARQIDLLGEMRRAGHDVMMTNPKRGAATMLLRPGNINPGAFWLPLAWEYGIDVRDATLDRRVIEFCVAVPQRQFRSAQWDRWLIRRAMDGLMPPEIVWSRRRGQQAADLVPRLRADSAAMAAALNDVERSAAVEILDTAYMRSVWDKVMHAEPSPQVLHDATTILIRGLAVGLFLAQFG